MKTLNINSPIAQRLAQIAIFERIQAMFNLYPSKIAGTVRNAAKTKNEKGADVAIRFRKICIKEFMTVLCFVTEEIRDPNAISGFKGSLQPYGEDVRVYFNLFQKDIVKGLQGKAKAEGLDPVECAEWLAGITPAIVDWAFDQAIEILKRDEK